MREGNKGGRKREKKRKGEKKLLIEKITEK